MCTGCMCTVRTVRIKWMTPNNCCKLFFVHWLAKGRCPYPFSQAKRQSNVLGGWVDKIYL